MFKFLKSECEIIMPIWYVRHYVLFPSKEQSQQTKMHSVRTAHELENSCCR